MYVAAGSATSSLMSASPFVTQLGQIVKFAPSFLTIMIVRQELLSSVGCLSTVSPIRFFGNSFSIGAFIFWLM